MVHTKFSERSPEDLVVYDKEKLLEIFPFGRTKLQALLNAGALPVVKIGRSYLSSPAMIERWLLENTGKEVAF